MAREQKNWLINQIVEEHLIQYSSKYMKGTMLDIGCGIKPYKKLLAPFIKEHVGLDHNDSQHDQSNVDLFGTAYEIPVKKDSFDSVLCSFVLEHLEEPSDSIKECHRVLKPGGYAIYMLPFIWHLHEEPRDFFRYTKYSLRYLFEKNGFQVVELVPLSGFIVTFSQLLVYYMGSVLSRRKFLKTLVKPLGNFIQWIAKKLNKYDHSYSWTWAYLIVVKKVT